jgi:hypothetical protein
VRLSAIAAAEGHSDGLGSQLVGNNNGTRGLHDRNRKIPRHVLLIFDDSRAMSASVRTRVGHSRRHKIYFELHGSGPTKVVFIMVRPFRLSSTFARWRRGYAGIARSLPIGTCGQPHRF